MPACYLEGVSVGGDRLPQDPFLLGYWGFDEANPTDPAVDESANANDLTFVGVPPVVPARVGNGRQFDGAAVTASPADSAVFRQWVNGTIIAWITLDSVNQAGDALRPIVCLDGPTGGDEDLTTFALYVDNLGRVIFRFAGRYNLDAPVPQTVDFRSPVGTILVGRYYSVVLTQSFDADGNPTPVLYVNNEPVPWGDVIVNGVVDPTGNGLPPWAVGNTTVLTVGGSQKSASKWHGVIDELSIHSTSRPFYPYLVAAYNRVTLGVSSQKLTALGNISVLGAADMGGGVRWWCYERDKSIYVIRENSLGLFSAEILLTTAGLQASGAVAPGGVEQPRLTYDPVSDTLLVAFIGGGRVFKITAKSSDPPTTQNMGFTQDTAAVLKATDPTDVTRLCGGTTDAWPVTGDSLAAGTIAFLDTPTFGVAVWGNATKYALYRRVAQTETLLAVVSGQRQQDRVETRGNYWFVPLPVRTPGASYIAYPMRPTGQPGSNRSNVLIDLDLTLHADSPTQWVWNRYGEATDGLDHLVASGSTQFGATPIVQVTRGVLKQQTTDATAMAYANNDSPRPTPMSQVTRGVIKINAPADSAEAYENNGTVFLSTLRRTTGGQAGARLDP